jgi:hypothetical protein
MRRAVAAVGVGLLVAGCGAGGSDEARPGVRARSALGLGERLTLPTGESIAVHEYRAGQPALVEVEACAGTDGRSSAEPGRFRLELEDGGAIAATSPADEPSFQAPSTPGECRRGRIAYEVGPGQTPAAVTFTAGEATARWRVP